MDNEQNRNKNSRIIDVDLQNEMRKSFLDYSMSVIVSRCVARCRRWFETCSQKNTLYNESNRS